MCRQPRSDRALIQALVHITALVAVALAADGMAWILALSTLNSLYQLSLPQWVKARGMSFYLVVFQGGSAVGSVAFGVAAQRIGLAPALLAAAARLTLGPLAGLRYRFQTIPPHDLLAAGKAGSWSSSSSPPGRSTSGSTPASPSGTSNGTTRSAP